MIEEALPRIGVASAAVAEALLRPGHVGQQVIRLHGGDDAEISIASKVGGIQDLRVFDAGAAIASDYGLRNRNRRDDAARIPLGSRKCIERHLYRTISDGMKAHLEVLRSALLRHCIELGLVVAWNTAVAGIVAVGRVERGGTRPERPVHKALQHAGVQHWVVGGMMRAMLLQRLDRIGEGQPFGDADRQVILALELLHHQEIIPLGVVLHAGHAVDGGIRKCQ